MVLFGIHEKDYKKTLKRILNYRDIIGCREHTKKFRVLFKNKDDRKHIKRFIWAEWVMYDFAIKIRHLSKKIRHLSVDDSVVNPP